MVARVELFGRFPLFIWRDNFVAVVAEVVDCVPDKILCARSCDIEISFKPRVVRFDIRVRFYFRHSHASKRIISTLDHNPFFLHGAK